MGGKKNFGGKGVTLKGNRDDNVLTGTDRNDKLYGFKGDDELFGLAGDDKLYGGKGDDALDGGAGRDLLIGGRGNDSLLGGAGDDVLYGDMPGKGWAWGKCVWWNPRSGFDDILDGGSGNDKVYAGRGDDVLLYSMAGNLGEGFADIGTHDVYDGGSGFDTLQLSLTHGEFLLASVQQDIAAFQAFLECRANPHSEHGKTFHFQSFDLDARNFEELTIERVNTAPTANPDAATANEDTPRIISAPSLLANDTDPDHLDVLSVKPSNVGVPVALPSGALLTANANGSFLYDPNGKFETLGVGAHAEDSFSYTIQDIAGATASATVKITVTGVNDAPVANNDDVAPTGGGGSQIKSLIDFELPPNEDYSVTGFAPLQSVGVGGSNAGHVGAGVGLGAIPDGAVQHEVDGQGFAVLSLAVASVRGILDLTIAGYDDGNQVVSHSIEDVKAFGDGYTLLSFGPEWGSIDELRFYGDAEIPPGDFILLDNLQLAIVTGGGDGVSEDTPIDIDVLDNDTDIDIGDVLEVYDFDLTSEMGAKISRVDGKLRYDPTTSDEIQALEEGETEVDSFHYRISDGNGGISDVATVSVTLLGADEPLSSGLLAAPDVDLLLG